MTDATTDWLDMTGWLARWLAGWLAGIFRSSLSAVRDARTLKHPSNVESKKNNQSINQAICC